MHEYFLQIVEHLEKRGYKKLNPDSNNVYGRVDESVVYVVVVGSSHNLDVTSLKKFNDKIYSDLTQNTGMRVELLNLLITPDGMFDSTIHEMLASMDNIWLFSADYGRLYVFENQTQDFDSLHEILDKKIDHRNRQIHLRFKKTFGVITPIFILINVIVFIIYISMIGSGKAPYIEDIMTLNLEAVISHHEYYRIITAIFFHFNTMHLFSNMIILLALGSRIEHIIGKIGFIIVYFLTGMIASVSSLISCYTGHYYDHAGGASGAIFGLLGIMIIFAFCNKGHVSGISMRSLIMLSVLTFINGYLSEGIDNDAHLGGLLSGLIIGVIIILYKQNKQKVVNKSSM